MTSFVFWNLMGNDQATWPTRSPLLLHLLSRMAATLEVDVFLFAESAFESPSLVDALNHAKVGRYRCPRSRSQRIQLVTRLPAKAVLDQFNDTAEGRLTIRRMTTRRGTEILLAATHYQSQLHWSRESQAMHAHTLRDEIAYTEDLVGYQRTMLVGDLNMDPFHLGLMGAEALNAAMDRDTARAEERIVSGRSYRFFYNPMWGLFGDRTPGCPGTYYRGTASPDAASWQMLDQLLLRPALMDHLDHLEIVDQVVGNSLLTREGHPHRSKISDHLPIFFRMNL